eukprot:SAG11_NODE_2739_length_3025_cov_1.861586_3_plen_131_part_00
MAPLPCAPGQFQGTGAGRALITRVIEAAEETGRAPIAALPGHARHALARTLRRLGPGRLCHRLRCECGGAACPVAACADGPPLMTLTVQDINERAWRLCAAGHGSERAPHNSQASLQAIDVIVGTAVWNE